MLWRGSILWSEYAKVVMVMFDCGGLIPSSIFSLSVQLKVVVVTVSGVLFLLCSLFRPLDPLRALAPSLYPPRVEAWWS